MIQSVIGLPIQPSLDPLRCQHGFKSHDVLALWAWLGTRTSDSLRVWGEHKQLDEAQAERGVVVFPDHSRDEEDLAVAGQQQGPEKQEELKVPAQHCPKEAEHAAAECWELYVTQRQTCQTHVDISYDECKLIFSTKGIDGRMKLYLDK